MQFTKGTKLVSFALVILFLTHIPLAPVVAQEVDGHTNYVNTLDWNASGDKLASGSTDQSVITWNTAGEFVDAKKSTVGPNGSVLDVSWTPDGEKIFAGDTDRTVLTFNSTEGDILPNVIFSDEHNGFVKSIAIDPTTDSSNALVASAGSGSQIRFWQLNNKTNSGYDNLARIQTPSGTTVGLEFSADGSILAMLSSVTTVVDDQPQSSGVLKVYNFTKVLENKPSSALNIIRPDTESPYLIHEQDFDDKLFAMDMNDNADKFIVASTSGVSTFTSVSGVTSLTEIGSEIQLDCGDCINMGIELNDDETSLAIAGGNRIEIRSFDPSVGIGSSTDFSITTGELDYNEEILAVDIAWHPSGDQITFAVGADIHHYNIDSGDQIFRINGEIPQANNIVFIVGVVLVLVIVLVIIVRRKM